MNSLKSLLTINSRTILIILILAGLIAFGFWKGCYKPKSETVQIENPLLLKQVGSFRDINGKLYAKLEEKVYTQAQVANLLDSVSKTLKIKVKQIKGIEKIVIRIDTVYRDLPTEPIIVTRFGDTAYQVQVHDGWNDIIATAGKDTGSISYKMRDSLTRIEVAKSPLIGPTKRYIYLTNTNPSMRIKEGASFMVKEKQPWLSIGPYIGYDPFSNRPSIGIGIQFPIINLKR